MPCPSLPSGPGGSLSLVSHFWLGWWVFLGKDKSVASSLGQVPKRGRMSQKVRVSTLKVTFLMSCERLSSHSTTWGLTAVRTFQAHTHSVSLGLFLPKNHKYQFIAKETYQNSTISKPS